MRAWPCFCVMVVACGGKIVETAPVDANERTGFVPAPGTTTSPRDPPPGTPTPMPGNPAPASVTPLDACEVLCERDARCDTTLPALPVSRDETGDCRTRCERRLAGRCGIDDWLLCFAASIQPDACTPLPDECKPAFCAWAACAKQPVSNCE